MRISKVASAIGLSFLVFAVGVVNANPPQRPTSPATGTPNGLSIGRPGPKGGFWDCETEIGSGVFECTYCQESESIGVTECVTFVWDRGVED